jgi:hypothetical protein
MIIFFSAIPLGSGGGGVGFGKQPLCNLLVYGAALLMNIFFLARPALALVAVVLGFGRGEVQSTCSWF